MFKFNRKAVTFTIASVFIVTVISMLGKELYETYKEKENLEREKNELDQEVTDLKEEKGSVESELEEKMEELKTSKEKQKKEEKEQEKLKKDNEKKNKEIQNKNEKIKKLEKDLQAKREREKKKNESVVATTSVATSNSSEKPVETDSKDSGNENNGSGKTMTMNTSYYGMDCAGCTGRTASGYNLSSGQTTVDGYRVVAADTSILPLHTKIKVTNPDGSSYNAIVLDRGGAIKGQKLDVLVGSEAESSSHGRHNTTIEVLSYGNNSYQKVN